VIPSSDAITHSPAVVIKAPETTPGTSTMGDIPWLPHLATVAPPIHVEVCLATNHTKAVIIQIQNLIFRQQLQIMNVLHLALPHSAWIKLIHHKQPEECHTDSNQRNMFLSVNLSWGYAALLPSFPAKVGVLQASEGRI
jgi:hypothetical protein